MAVRRRANEDEVVKIATGYFDVNEREIISGDKVNINANPYHGEYEVKFGEYQLKMQSKHDSQVPHLGFYLTNGKNILSLMDVLKQKIGFGYSVQRIEIIS